MRGGCNGCFLCVVLSLLLGLIATPPSFPSTMFAQRIVRNALLPRDMPAPLPVYAFCTEDDILDRLTVVASVKDTCTQGPSFLAHLANVLPRLTHVIYATPRFMGCDRINLTRGTADLLPRLHILWLSSQSSPIAGFLSAQRHISTPYALLLHNDAYVMDHRSICEMLRALEEHPESAFAAPQIYERSENGIVVPHGHHRNLHLRSTDRNNDKLIMSYDIDFDLLTRRLPNDYIDTEGAQLDFMEDHAYLGRTNTYHLYMDEHASFTMEYIDNVLAMRSNGTHPRYVPTSRVLFDVDVYKLGWREIPYFVWKRSERLGIEVRSYLAQKWNVTFPNTGIWNYVRYSMLQGLSLEDNSLPDDDVGTIALVLAWFHSLGFDTVNDYPIHEAATLVVDQLYDASEATLRLGRMSASDLMRSTESLALKRSHGVSCTNQAAEIRCAADILNVEWGGKRINISMDATRMPISFRLTDQCNPRECGMLLIVGGKCACYTNRMALPSPAPLRQRFLEQVLEVAKLPARIVRYIELQRILEHGPLQDNTTHDVYHCDADVECETTIVLRRSGEMPRIVRWAWSP